MAKILLIEDGQYLAASIKEQLEIPSTAAKAQRILAAGTSDKESIL